eukprot:GHVH01006741.1.p1 GENE.GHVH01006741.1~~GHVH01006741.1.p1  ORF type:complete len:537 (-),score=52.60 GHVH01006741.1:988-2598(-)
MHLKSATASLELAGYNGVMLVVIDWGRTFIKVGVGDSKPTYIERMDHHILYRQSSFGKVPLEFHEYVNIAEDVLEEVWKVGLPLVVDSQCHKVAWITASLSLPIAMIRALSLVLFSEQYNFEAIAHIPTPGAVLSACPVSSGLVIDLSGTGASISGVVDGHMINSSIVSIDGGGDLVTKSLRKLLLMWYAHCGDTIKEKAESDREMRYLEDSVQGLNQGWSFASYDDLNSITWEEWNNVKVACVYAYDGSVETAGKYCVRADSYVPVHRGNKVLIVPSSMRYQCCEPLLWDNFQPSFLAPRPFIDETKWQIPWSERLSFEEELPFVESLSDTGNGGPALPGIGVGEKIIRMIREEFVNDDGAPLDNHQGLMRAIVNSLESSGRFEGPTICQNIVLCGGTSEIFGLKDRIAMELDRLYSGAVDTSPSEAYDDDPYPGPSKRMSTHLDRFNMGLQFFTSGSLGWLGATINANVILREGVLQTAILHLNDVVPQRDQTEQIAVVSELDRIKLAEVSTLSSQIIFRRIYDPYSTNWCKMK